MARESVAEGAREERSWASNEDMVSRVTPWLLLVLALSLGLLPPLGHDVPVPRHTHPTPAPLRAKAAFWAAPTHHSFPSKLAEAMEIAHPSPTKVLHRMLIQKTEEEPVTIADVERATAFLRDHHSEPIDCVRDIDEPEMPPQAPMVLLIDLYWEFDRDSLVVDLMAAWLECGTDPNPIERTTGMDVLTRAFAISAVDVLELLIQRHGARPRLDMGLATTTSSTLAFPFFHLQHSRGSSVELARQLLALRTSGWTPTQDDQHPKFNRNSARLLAHASPTFAASMRRSLSSQVNSMPRYGKEGLDEILDDEGALLLRLLFQSGVSFDTVATPGGKSRENFLHFLARLRTGKLTTVILELLEPGGPDLEAARTPLRAALLERNVDGRTPLHLASLLSGSNGRSTLALDRLYSLLGGRQEASAPDNDGHTSDELAEIHNAMRQRSGSDSCDMEEVLAPITTEEFRRIVRLNKPVMFRSALQWHGFDKRPWHPDTLIQRHAPATVMVGEIPYFNFFNLSGGEISLMDFASAMASSSSLSVDGTPVSVQSLYTFSSEPCRTWLDCDVNMLPPFVRDLASWKVKSESATGAPGMAEILPQFYFGDTGTGAPVHYHNDAVNVLLFGTKEWFLFPPEHALYSVEPPFQWDAAGPLGAYPEDSPALRCVQHADDVAYIPEGWGHGTRNAATSIGVAFELSLRQAVRR
uniref:JmjC domain-containing protein n=2 Tax=Rhizochromulina marina TaxID=1034831 RepID=A0A7S2SR03_9STRA|mmetsp:Transcript_4804/g.14288  ORF Transcript_4804/g.14288 Transcript_4804/m.14288 type:complete len:698 (+) Transcript_4804:116-2209(+)|eukprot:CAMPEP_0118996278 /NCGR_PEP_ID=MMETSP1173-20130426/59782_1 /TAXON_ID=1034831 /ORGANISM="Rhizochromulina marina cf, Strain CCMP1243" /LENGTH=697 /DNA_ID=CAMNT_0006947663 /DNA_START=14 /DNA_END=2107 /DNA_ORIENTATION=+